MGFWSGDNLKDLDYDEIYEEAQENSAYFSKFTHNKPIKHRYTLKTNRLVPAQPIRFETFHTDIEARFNLRKLSMLPYHLIKAGMIDSKYFKLKNFINIQIQ